MQAKASKMTVEVWSDVMCPFCYVGKRRFEAALAQFAERDAVELVWKSFQLMPSLKTEPGLDLEEFLAREKGMGLKDVRQMNARIVEMGGPDGLTFNFGDVVVANSFDAHRLLHFAREHGKQNEAKEALFRAYFTDGKNVDDRETLLALGAQVGLDTAALAAALDGGAFAEEVRQDIAEAQQLGVRGVPFFVYDRKYAVSGAQDRAVFLQALQQAFDEWRQSHPPTPAARPAPAAPPAARPTSAAPSARS